ncbi:MAG: Blue (Type 1) copper protein [Parcubacteria group bacterium]|nr:Blue (Type 1) copper protein [Parcubacteria group bacterium]
MNKMITLVVVLVLLIGGYFIFHDKEAMDDMPATPDTSYGTDSGMVDDGTVPAPVSTSTSATPAPVSAPTSKTFTVTGSNFAFAPSALSVNKGDKVTIIFKNSGGLHDFKIDEFAAATKRINGGESDTVTFTADRSGSFEFYCSVGTHRQMGMKGTLTVK